MAHTLSPSTGAVAAGEISSSQLAWSITEFSRSAMAYTVNLCLKTVNKPLPFLGQIWGSMAVVNSLSILREFKSFITTCTSKYKSSDYIFTTPMHVEQGAGEMVPLVKCLCSDPQHLYNKPSIAALAERSVLGATRGSLHNVAKLVSSGFRKRPCLRN